MKFTGEPIPIASGVSINSTLYPRATASGTGLIAYRPDISVRQQVTWFDRSGKPAGTVGEPLAYMRMGDLSPDGHTLAIAITQGEMGSSEISLMDMARGTLTPFTTEPENVAPSWSPDGTKIAYDSGRNGILDIYWKAVGSSGPDELVFASKEAKNLTDWSPDGQYLLFSSQSPATARDVWALPVVGADRRPIPVAQTAAEERDGKFSPDGKWVAYDSDETGRNEVFVRPFPGPGAAIRVSTGGGVLPFWRRDGKELYYTTQGQLMAVSIGVPAGGALGIGMPQSLFKVRGRAVPETDGQRFLFLEPLGDVSTPPITVIVNWAGQGK